ncbi:hypothetical protein TWF730_007944 [Orbilia blumenaviensis]|uniref:Uncharacterized protein n=1 Tax=Orbilia blumenaviensis TaxID=1796055 RepID=A0AAV9VC25_9PEZI
MDLYLERQAQVRDQAQASFSSNSIISLPSNALSIHPKFHHSHKLLFRLSLLGLRCIILFAFLNLTILLPARQLEIGFTSSTKQVFNSAIILTSLLIARAVKHFYEECAKLVRWAFLRRSAHTYKQVIQLLSIDSITVSASIVWSYIKHSLPWKYKRDQASQRRSEIILVFLLLFVAILAELAIALLGFTFEIDDVSYLEIGNDAYMTNWLYISPSIDESDQELTARINGLTFLNKFGDNGNSNPLDLSRRGLHWNIARPTEYLYTFLEWDSPSPWSLGRPSRWPTTRNITTSSDCIEAGQVGIVQDDVGCKIYYSLPSEKGSKIKTISHEIPNFNCNLPNKSIFIRTKDECGPRCSNVIVLEALTSYASPLTKLFLCSVTVGKVIGASDEAREEIRDPIAKIFASSISHGAYSSTDPNSTISSISTLSITNRATPHFIFSNPPPNAEAPYTHPSTTLNLTFAQYTAAILSRFAISSISSTDGSNPRFKGLGKTNIKLDRLTVDAEFLNGLIGGAGLLIVMTLAGIGLLVGDMEIPDDKSDNVAMIIKEMVEDVEVRTEKKRAVVRYVSGIGLKVDLQDAR